MASSDNGGARHDSGDASAERPTSAAAVDAPAADQGKADGQAADGDVADAESATGDAAANGPATEAATGGAPTANQEPASAFRKVRDALRSRARPDRDGDDSDRDASDGDDSSGSRDNPAPSVEQASSGDDTSGELVVEQVERPLISGDPLLTGPTPVVRKSKRKPKAPTAAGDPEPATSERADPTSATPESAQDSGGERSGDGASDASIETSDEPAPDDGVQEESAEATASDDDGSAETAGVAPAADQGEPDPPSTAGQPASSGTPAVEAASVTSTETPGDSRPDPRDLLAPAGTDGEPGAPPSALGDVSGPVPAAPESAPPPAPVLRAPSTPPPVPTRQAMRGRQATTAAPGPPRATPSGDPSGPVTRPTAVAPAPRVVGRRPRVRRVTRVVRHVDPWSVFKIAAVFSFVAYGIALVAGVLLWNVAYATGTIDNIERGLESTGWESFELNGAEIFRNAWMGGIFVAVGLTGLAVLTATLFNLVTDLVGGVRMTVLEEEVIEKPASPSRRYAGQRQQQPAPPPARRVPPAPRR